MKTNLSKFHPDRDLANDGVWFELYPERDATIKFKLAYAGQANKAFKAATMKLALKSGIRETEVNKLSVEQMIALNDENIPIYAETIVKNWQGVLNEDDEIIPYSVENATAILRDYPEVFEKVAVLSKDSALFRVHSPENKVNIKKK